MIDANQSLDLAKAMSLAEAAVDMNIRCFEDPIHHQHYDGYQILKQKTGIALTMGERKFDTLPLRELSKMNAIYYWQPDLLRIGAVGKWRKSAVLADSFHTRVLPHYYKNYDASLLQKLRCLTIMHYTKWYRSGVF